MRRTADPSNTSNPTTNFRGSTFLEILQSYVNSLWVFSFKALLFEKLHLVASRDEKNTIRLGSVCQSQMECFLSFFAELFQTHLDTRFPLRLCWEIFRIYILPFVKTSKSRKLNFVSKKYLKNLADWIRMLKKLVIKTNDGIDGWLIMPELEDSP